MNKGKRLVFCKKCNRKRFCTRIPIPGFNFRYTCSKGHSWEIEGVTAERVVAAMEEHLLPNIKNLFEREDTFFREMMKRKC